MSTKRTATSAESFHETAPVLVFNVGSSSLSLRLYRHSQELLRGKCHRVGVTGTEPSFAEYRHGTTLVHIEAGFSDHLSAARHVLDYLAENHFTFDAVGHRYGHGGDSFADGVVLDDRSRAELERIISLAPLHNGAALAIADLIDERQPCTPQFVVFDSTFHRTMPEVARTYALPIDMAMSYCKHGLSYADVVEKAAWYLGEERFKAVALHLGTGGSSACAIVDGHSIDTSMGYSPLQGLVMNTRCGDLDPGVAIDLLRRGYTCESVNRVLHSESGLLGLSGGASSDIRDLIALMPQDPRARLAFDVYVYRVKQYIGAYTAVMNGLDLLIFTDDVGLKVPEVRREICLEMDHLGIRLDEKANSSARPDAIEPLHSHDSAVRILAIPNDEERAIYDQGLRLLAQGRTFD
jgi:acetate kinase